MRAFLRFLAKLAVAGVVTAIGVGVAAWLADATGLPAYVIVGGLVVVHILNKLNDIENEIAALVVEVRGEQPEPWPDIRPRQTREPTQAEIDRAKEWMRASQKP